MSEKFSQEEIGKIQAAITNHTATKVDFMDGHRGGPGDDLESALREDLKPVQGILEMRNLTADDLNFVLGSRPDDGSAWQEAGEWNQTRQTLRELGIRLPGGEE